MYTYSFWMIDINTHTIGLLHILVMFPGATHYDSNDKDNNTS